MVTPGSNDVGMDGYAKHPNGLIVVQCKRYTPPHKVGRPTLQQFKSVIADQGAFRGYAVTISNFTLDATLYGSAAESIMLVDTEGCCGG